jgi:hypothetical protein
MDPKASFKLIFKNMFDKDITQNTLYAYFKDALSHPYKFFDKSKHGKYINDIKKALGSRRIIRIHRFVPIVVNEEIEDDIDILGFADQKTMFDSNYRKGYAPTTVNISYEEKNIRFINELNGETIEMDME